MTALQPMDMAQCRKVGIGVKRPEDVLVSRDGAVWLSDQDSACAKVLSDPEGRIMRSPTNVSWGGPDMRDLYIGSVVSNYVVHVRSPIPGMPLAHQR